MQRKNCFVFRHAFDYSFVVDQYAYELIALSILISVNHHILSPLPCQLAIYVQAKHSKTLFSYLFDEMKRFSCIQFHSIATKFSFLFLSPN